MLIVTAALIYQALNVQPTSQPLGNEKQVGGLTCVETRETPAIYDCTLAADNDPHAIYDALNVAPTAINPGIGGKRAEQKQIEELTCTKRVLLTSVDYACDLK